MTALELPAPDATFEEWGRLAVSLPGWRWMPGMLDTKNNRWGEVTLELCREWRDSAPYPDDPAVAGCMLRLLESEDISLHSDGNGSPIYLDWWDPKTPMNDPIRFEAPTIGRVCIMVAAHIGRWPGGKA